MIMLMRRILIV
jgi:hypothetical protein